MNGIVFLTFLFISSLLAYKNATHFWVLSLYPPTCWIHLSVLEVSWWNLWGSQFIVSWNLQKRTVLLLPFQFGCLLFLLVVWLLWLVLLVLCWIREVKVDIPALFPILSEMLVVSHFSVMLAVGLSNINWLYEWVYFVARYYVPWVQVAVLMPVPDTFYHRGLGL